MGLGNGSSSTDSYRVEFDKLDKDRSGSISRDELKKKLFGVVPDKQMETIMNYADKDKDGTLSFDEYKKIMKKVETVQKLVKKFAK